MYSAYVTNRSPSVGREVTACELWTGRKPDVSNMRVFGCIAYNHVPKEHRQKLDNTGKKMIMMGYSTSGYRLLEMETNKVINARNVIFDERLKEDQTVFLPSNSEILSIQGKGTEQETTEEREKVIEKPVTEEQDEGRIKRKTQKPKWHEDYEINLSEGNDEALFALLTNYEEVPLSYQEIEDRRDKQDWKKAVDEEVKILAENQTWKVVSKPEKENLLDSKWIFTKKIVEGKEICKARLVVRGFQQKEQLEDIYSPVLKLQTLRILLSIAVCRKYHIHQMDVKGAFLYGKMNEDVYLLPPEGQVLKLEKSLYGLRKSPKYWYEKFNNTINEYGFRRSDNYYCLYSMGDMYLSLYVDDLLILGSSLQEIKKLKEFLSTKFRMKDMGCENLTFI